MVTTKWLTDKYIWEKFVLSFKGANFLQSWNWGQFHQNLGKKIYRIGFFKENKLIGVMLCVVEKAKRATYLTVPGGPLINDHFDVFKKTVVEISRAENCSFVRVRPELLDNEKNNKLFVDLGFKIAPMHLHAELTRQLNLKLSEEELLSQMRKTTRYEIKKAINLGIKVVSSQKLQDIDDFYKLQAETAKRQGFVPFNKNFLKEQFSVFAKDDQIILYTSCLNKLKLAQAFIIFYGEEADYHYGASTLDGRKYPGAYLIQWEAIKEAKKRGMKRYNLWGVAPEEDKNHRFYGVSVFKRGFGGEDVEYIHARDLIINPVTYKINWLIETIRRKSRRV